MAKDTDMREKSRDPARSGRAPNAPPADFDALRAHLAAAGADLPKRLAQAAEFALANPDEVALGTAASVAGAADVQPSTLVRLARQLGYQGFSDFQRIFRERLKSRASSYEERLKKIDAGAGGDTYEAALVNGFLAAARRSLDSLAETLDTAEFSRAVGTLAEAETIYLIARRRAYPLAAHMAYAFGKLKIRFRMIDSANGIDPEIADLATPRDAAIACSFSPYAPASVEQVETMRRNRVPIIAMTDSALSPLAASATHWLDISEHDFADFRSLSASMALAMALPVAIAERRRYRKA